MHDYRAIMRAILEGYVLPPRGYHGVVHWARVAENGLRIAEDNGGDLEVVRLFALFHDSCRVNEQIDHGHGERGAELAVSLRGSLLHLEDERFELLYAACALHTDGLTEAEATLEACWDADRLDLGRVGITPRRRFLCTAVAQELLGWAHDRAVSGHAPAELLASWGVGNLPSGAGSSAGAGDPRGKLE